MTYNYPNADWDRLPWLVEHARRPVRRIRGAVLAGLVVLLAADAAGSYAAGRLSGARQQRSSDGNVGLAPAQAETLARQISNVQQIAWQRRRPNAPY